MAKFKVVQTRRCAEVGEAEFAVEWLDGTLSPGQTFTVFDTHHPIEVKVIASTARSGGAVLRCKIDLGWDGNFAPSVIDTNGSTRLERFRYFV